MTRIGPCMDWGPTPALSVAGYWQFVTDTCNINRYIRDMCMYESAQICGGDTNKSSEIQTDINRYNSPKFFFSGEVVHITSISVYISSISGSYLCISCLNDVYMFKYQLLREFFYLFKQDIN